MGPMMALPMRLTFRAVGLSRLSVITSYKFPSTLKPGEEISGTITITNPESAEGPSHTYTVHVIPQWAPEKETTASATLAPAETKIFNFPADFAPAMNLPLIMPSQNATITLKVTDENNVVVGEATVTIKVQWLFIPVFGQPLWLWLAISGGIITIIALATTRKKK